jgi:hypothetical protein
MLPPINEAMVPPPAANYAHFLLCEEEAVLPRQIDPYVISMSLPVQMDHEMGEFPRHWLLPHIV